MSNQKELYAAVDLGSNSFHMIVAEMIDNQLHIIDRHKDMVRLANGLDRKGNLSKKKIDEAIASLEKIGQRIEHISKSNFRVVGTNTLRKAKNSADFIPRAEKALGKPIDIVSGREEARILYLGVAHCLPSNQGQRLVIDIGGGSTELIIGEDFEPRLRESLHMGCVSYTKKFFSNGIISRENINNAVLHARRQLMPIVSRYSQEGWNDVIGASGTMRAASEVIIENGFAVNGIDKKSLKDLIDHCIDLGDIQNLKSLKGLSPRRKPVFIAGLTIIQALFDSLLLDNIQSCSGALREGIVYDLSGRLHHNDIRQRTLDKLANQFEIKAIQSLRVKVCIDDLVNVSNLNLSNNQLDLLKWSAQLHELGLKISHSHFEKHAAYILSNADMPGFSNQEQLKLAVLVAVQRRKIKKDWIKKLSDYQYQKILPLIIIFRLAVIINRPRINCINEVESINFSENSVRITFKQGWLENHPLTFADLKSEAKYLTALDLDYIIE
ncbi:MAG: exopolyphosphatase [Marinicellaceae bacterium]